LYRIFKQAANNYYQALDGSGSNPNSNFFISALHWTRQKWAQYVGSEADNASRAMTMSTSLAQLEYEASQYAKNKDAAAALWVNGYSSRSFGDATSGTLITAFKYVWVLMQKYFTMPLILAGAVSAVSLVIALLIILSPLIFVSAILPGRGKSLVLFFEALVVAKLTLFLMYLFLNAGGYLVQVLINDGIGMEGGSLAALRFTVEGLILVAVLYGAQKLSRILVFGAAHAIEDQHSGEAVVAAVTSGYVALRSAIGISKSVTHKVSAPMKAQSRSVAAARQDARVTARIDSAVSTMNQNMDKKFQDYHNWFGGESNQQSRSGRPVNESPTGSGSKEHGQASDNETHSSTPHQEGNSSNPRTQSASDQPAPRTERTTVRNHQNLPIKDSDSERNDKEKD
jgi:hypothetical protein